jgi:4-amino-4-deoxychorismate lyase
MRFLETIRAEGGTALHLAYHRRRMARTLEAFGIAAEYDLESLIRPPSGELTRCRLLYGSGGVQITYHPYTPRTFRALQAVVCDHLAYEFKYADRSALDAAFEGRGTADDVVIVQNGLLTDTTIANIALFDGDRWITPRSPLLRGTTRDRLLESGFLSEGDIPLETLERYERCALMNAMVGFVEVENGIISPR